LFAFSSCEIINPEEEIPSYIHIDSIHLNTSDKPPYNITDAWVYVNDDLKGVYELPATFPILAGGPNNVQIKPGIEMNGIALTRIPYPFFTAYITSEDLIRDSVITINPETNPTGNVVWEEDFENVGITLQATSQSDTAAQRTDDPSIIFQGDGCGAFILYQNQNTFEAISSNTFAIPYNSSAIFLEIDYKCNNQFSVGIFANSVSQSIQVAPSLVINPKAQWNKIYINLTQEINAQINALNYNIYFGILKDSGVDVAEVYVDNIKLIYL